MSKILVLGAGFVAGPLVRYLTGRNYDITVASQFIEDAHHLQDDFSSIEICEIDVLNDDALGQLVKGHDLVISFVPHIFHLNVARQCIKFSKHMVTASYETEEMKALDEQAINQNVTILNEIGLDPGIDHLSAMKEIDDIHARGGKLKSFISWCGGLPAPSSNDNPLGYKFAWAPISALMALLNEATYRKNGKTVTVSEKELLNDIQQVEISDELNLEGYPNRNSINYRDIYGITDADDILRGTLRYQGFSAIMQSCKVLGLLETREKTHAQVDQNWLTLMRNATPEYETTIKMLSKEVKHALQWLGLFEEQRLVQKNVSIIDAFCTLLVEKLSYTEGEQDMVVLQHQFISETSDGKVEKRSSTLIKEGNKNGYSAMALTVGTPAAIAADLILSGKITDRGVILPMTKSIYEPLLRELANQGIRIDEKLVAG